MPYRLEGNCVVNSDTGKTVPGGCHPNRKKALAHLQALYANVSDASKIITSVGNTDGIKTSERSGASWSHILGPKQVKPVHWYEPEGEKQLAEDFEKLIQAQGTHNVRVFKADVLNEPELIQLAMNGIDKADVIGVHTSLPAFKEGQNLVAIGRRYVEYTKKIDTTEKSESDEDTTKKATGGVVSDTRGKTKMMAQCPECQAHFELDRSYY
jgi:hypothetical protein